MHCERQSIDSSPDLGVQSLLAVVTLLTDSHAPEAARHTVPREGHYGTISHHVGVLLSLKQLAVTEDDNSFYVVRVLVVPYDFLVRGVTKQVSRNKTVVFGQSNLVLRL